LSHSCQLSYQGELHGLAASLRSQHDHGVYPRCCIRQSCAGARVWTDGLGCLCSMSAVYWSRALCTGPDGTSNGGAALRTRRVCELRSTWARMCVWGSAYAVPFRGAQVRGYGLTGWGACAAYLRCTGLVHRAPDRTAPAWRRGFAHTPRVRTTWPARICAYGALRMRFRGAQVRGYGLTGWGACAIT
jgi:hypothetical protein